MPSLKSRIAFAAKHFTSPDGLPWSLTGRQWVLDEIWRPLDGWKLWPEDKQKLCDDCARLAGTIVEDYHEADKTQTAEHKASGCSGLRSEPVLILLANLKRQSGKTFNTAAWCVTQAALSDHQSIALLAGSEDQIKRLFDSNYKRPVENDRKLSTMFRAMGTRLICDKRGSDIELLPTTISSVGDTRTTVVVDECRKVPADIGPAMFATMLARGGWECPTRMRSHARTHDGVDEPGAPKTCSVCGKATQPWFGKSMFLSSAGEIKDSDADWFFDMVDHFVKSPHPNVHVFASTDNLNPKSSAKVSSVLSEVFGAVEATRVAAGIEAGNERLKKGQQFMTAADMRACVDDTLRNLESCSRRCVGVLDTSEDIEKTSLVVLAEEEACAVPWDLLVQARCDFWIPSQQPGGIVDAGAVEAHVRSILTTFTGMKAFHIDTRGSKQWTEMYQRLRKDFPIVSRWIANKGEDKDGGRILFRRMSARPKPRIRLQSVAEQAQEFTNSVWKKDKDGNLFLADGKPRGTKINGVTVHLDIVESLQCCCFLADMLSRRQGNSGFGGSALIKKDTASAIEKLRASVKGTIAGGQNFGGPGTY